MSVRISPTLNDPRTLLALAVEIIRELADFDGEAGEYADPRVEDFMQGVGRLRPLIESD